MQNIRSVYVNEEWYKNDFVLCTQAQQVFYIDYLLNGPNWKVVHLFAHRHVWDLPVIEENNDTTPTFELVVDLPNTESMFYQREDATSSVLVDDEIIYIIETDDEDIDEDVEVDDTVDEYIDDEDSEDSDDE